MGLPCPQGLSVLSVPKVTEQTPVQSSLRTCHCRGPRSLSRTSKPKSHGDEELTLQAGALALETGAAVNAPRGFCHQRDLWCHMKLQVTQPGHQTPDTQSDLLLSPAWPRPHSTLAALCATHIPEWGTCHLPNPRSHPSIAPPCPGGSCEIQAFVLSC